MKFCENEIRLTRTLARPRPASPVLTFSVWLGVAGCGWAWLGTAVCVCVPGHGWALLVFCQMRISHETVAAPRPVIAQPGDKIRKELRQTTCGRKLRNNYERTHAEEEELLNKIAKLLNSNITT